jgi:photosystem II stability/assembly factor-like uncharacterized protein
MKQLILLELCLIFLAASFKGDSPTPGWFIQQIPVNKQISDIYFVDTLNGWAVASNPYSQDSAYILKTTNGGTNWMINIFMTHNLFAIKFIDLYTGYACGGWGIGKLYKTTNGGNNWNIILNNGSIFTDLWFINKDTGWVADNGPVPFGIGLLKTTNGGINWTQQLSNAYMPEKLFFLNKDTGWVVSQGGELYRTNNSGNTFNQIYDFGSTVIYNLYFTTIDTGWIIKFHEILKTVNGGYNWILQTDPDTISGSAPTDIVMMNSKLGYISTIYSKIIKTYDGINWKKQNAPQGSYIKIFFTDSLHGWVSHNLNGINGTFDMAATIDGGGPVMQIINNNEQIAKDYKLFQNYPNPFNPLTNIKYQITNSKFITLKVYTITGKEVSTLVNKKQTTGTYEINFDGGNLPSGVYFYRIQVEGGKGFTEVKKMVLLK